MYVWTSERGCCSKACEFTLSQRLTPCLHCHKISPLLHFVFFGIRQQKRNKSPAALWVFHWRSQCRHVQFLCRMPPKSNLIGDSLSLALTRMFWAPFHELVRSTNRLISKCCLWWSPTCLAGDQGEDRRLWQHWRDGPKGNIGLYVLLSGPTLQLGLFSKRTNETLRTRPQGEEGIKGEKGMRGLWGQAVIHRAQIHLFLYREILYNSRINEILC